MKMLLARILFLWAFTWREASAEEPTTTSPTVPLLDSDCPEVWQNFCSREANRYCFINEEGKHKCGTCLPGFFEFKARCIDEGKLDILQFIKEYVPEYLESLSMADRAKLYIEVVRFIIEHNNKNPPPEYEVGLNKYSLDTGDDYASLRGFDFSIQETADKESLNAQPVLVKASGAPLTQIDWVDEGAVTNVKDQGRCGCCWAVTAAGAVEGAVAVNTDYLQSLSWQQWISCDTNNFGCNGGSLVYAMVYGLQNNFGGITRLSSYEYSDHKGSTTEQCEVSGKPLSVAVEEASYVLDFSDDISFQERMDRMKAAVSLQPVAIVIKSACKLFTNYKSGILTDDEDCACSEMSCVDHALLLVGYNDNDRTPYWKIKNSWSAGWGEDGYVRIAQKEKGPYGLFALLSHGVVPDLAYNVTEQIVEPTEYESSGSGSSELEWWVWLIIIVGIVGCVCFCCACFFGRKK